MRGLIQRRSPEHPPVKHDSLKEYNDRVQALRRAAKSLGVGPDGWTGNMPNDQLRMWRLLCIPF